MHERNKKMESRSEQGAYQLEPTVKYSPLKPCLLRERCRSLSVVTRNRAQYDSSESSPGKPCSYVSGLSTCAGEGFAAPSKTPLLLDFTLTLDFLYSQPFYTTEHRNARYAPSRFSRLPSYSTSLSKIHVARSGPLSPARCENYENVASSQGSFVGTHVEMYAHQLPRVLILH